MTLDDLSQSPGTRYEPPPCDTHAADSGFLTSPMQVPNKPHAEGVTTPRGGPGVTPLAAARGGVNLMLGCAGKPGRLEFVIGPIRPSGAHHDHSERTRRRSSVSDVPPVSAAPAPAAAPVPRSRLWLRGALFLAAGAQLITISALVSADPLAVTWSALLLAIAPAPLVAVAAFAPATVARPAAVVAAVVLVVGIIGGILHTGLFFVPALAVLAVGGVKLWREPS
jgi:hypothetical protein